MQMYEFNCGNYASLPNLAEEEILFAKQQLDFFIKNTPSKYFMLLNNESRYYTLFAKVGSTQQWHEKLSDEIIDIAQSLGNIKSIEPNYDGSAFEFWVENNGECICYFLFDYNKGVIEI